MKIFFRLSLLLSILFFALAGPDFSLQAAAEAEDETVIEAGISAAGQDLSGLTAQEAADLLNDTFEEIAGSVLTVTFDGQRAVTTPALLGFSWDVEETVREAASLGKDGSLIARYKSQMDLKYAGITLDVSYTYDETAIRSFVRTRVASHDAEPKNASLEREDGELVITQEENGRATDVSATVAAIEETLDHSLSAHMTAEAVVELSAPEVTADLLSRIRDVLGTYSTDYSSSTTARQTNIAVASGRIDGTVLMPGESLSVSDKILSRTPENGYQLATQYNNGETEEAYGGGVCQVSTTLYNAVIRAELQVDERHPHSMVVAYVPYSSDAAIAEGSKDFVFTNDTDDPIYLAADADGETLTFTIYGHETREEGRSVEFISDTLSYADPEPTERSDDSLPEGETRTEGTVHPAVSSTLTKVVSQDGVEISREIVNQDSYEGSGLIIYRGTYREEEETEEETEPEVPETEPAAESEEDEPAGDAQESIPETEPETGETEKAAEETGESTEPSSEDEPEEKESEEGEEEDGEDEEAEEEDADEGEEEAEEEDGEGEEE